MSIRIAVTPGLDPRLGAAALFGAGTLRLPGAGRTAMVLPGPAHTQVGFAGDIQPLLERSCLLHRGEKAKARVQLNNREALLQGGAGKEAPVVPGNGAASPLLRFSADLVEEMELPPLQKRARYPKWSDSEIALVCARIEQPLRPA